MQYTVLEKRSNIAGEIPQVSDLEKGQIAINFADKKIYGLSDAGVIVQLSLAPSDFATVAFTGDYNDLLNLPSGGGGTGTPGSIWYTGAAAPVVGIGINGDYYLNSTNGDYYKKTANAWNLIGNLMGPQGVEGPTGPQGPAGTAGTNGNTVLSGNGIPTSSMGNNGDYYIDDSTWLIYGPKAGGAWPAGSSLVGPAGGGSGGAALLYGAADPTSGIGVDTDFYINDTTWMIFGPKTGGVWPTGVSIIGPMGPQGPAGPTGADGTAVLSGSGAPSNALGIDGDYYIDDASWFIYGPKLASIWPSGVSIIGPQGTPGTIGTNGNTVITGTVAPTSGIGANGDYYINDTTWLIYGPKTNGAWPSGVSIIGPMGAAGTNGNTVLSGSGAPAVGIGNNGDYYIDDTSWFIYGPKAGGLWPSGVSIIGPQGTAGTPGTNGNTVITGTVAPTNAIGNNGDYYINDTSWFIYGPKVGGVWPSGVSIIGPMGTTGTPGTNGNTVLSGSGAPSNVLGNNGDYYINDTTWFIYGPKASGTWPVGVSIIGPMGAAGLPGPYDLAGTIFGMPIANAVVMRFVASRAYTLPASYTGSMAKCSTAPTATETLTIYKNGVSIGTITFAPAALVGTFAGTGASFVIGDVLTVANQATADTTFGDAEFTLVTTLN